MQRLDTYGVEKLRENQATADSKLVHAASTPPWLHMLPPYYLTTGSMPGLLTVLTYFEHQVFIFLKLITKMLYQSFTVVTNDAMDINFI